jgi:hypothetical protein
MTTPKPSAKPPPKLFSYEIDIGGRIKACLSSGVDLTTGEQDFLRAFPYFRHPSQQQYRTFWDLCSRCGVK